MVIYKFWTNLVWWYAWSSWTSQNNYINNSTSWLFNLATNTRQIVNVYPQYAQYDNDSYWPTFWWWHDLSCGSIFQSCYGSPHSYSPNPVNGYVSGSATDLEVYY
jgi:hypothetical protein